MSGRLRVWSFWLLLTALVTAALYLVRDGLDQASVALIYLLLVLGASAGGGRALGFTLAGASFGLFDYYLQRPFDQFTIAKPLDWLVLIAFLTTAAVAAQLLGDANAAAAAARQRAAEVEQLSRERVRLVEEAEHAKALAEADRLKDALLAAVSHDLRTPLTTIKALARELAVAGEERAAIIEQQADRLNRVVESLLDMSRLNAGAVRVESEVNAAEDLVGAALQSVASALPGREIRAAVAWSEPMLLGRFDFVHSLRVLTNLIENAAKYSPAGAPIDVAVSRDGAWLRFSVADRGPGVPATEKEGIFRPFFRSPSNPAQVSGAGLGLAISRRLAEEQGGALELADRPGGGSVFTLRLPAVDLETS